MKKTFLYNNSLAERKEAWETEELPDLMPAGGVPLRTPVNQEATLLVGWQFT